MEGNIDKLKASLSVGYDINYRPDMKVSILKDNKLEIGNSI